MNPFAINSNVQIDSCIALAKLLVSSCDNNPFARAMRDDFIKALKRIRLTKDTIAQGEAFGDAIVQRQEIASRAQAGTPPVKITINMWRTVWTATVVIDSMESALAFQTVNFAYADVERVLALKSVLKSRLGALSAIRSAAERSRMFPIETFARKIPGTIQLGAVSLSVRFFAGSTVTSESPSEYGPETAALQELIDLQRQGDLLVRIAENILTHLHRTILQVLTELAKTDPKTASDNPADFESEREKFAQVERLLEAAAEIYSVVRLSAQSFARFSWVDLATAMARLGEANQDATTQ